MSLLYKIAVTSLAAALRMSFVLLAPALGEAISEQAGVYNIGVEGYMIMGALSAYYGVILTGNLWLGVAIGILGGMVISLIHAYLSITLKTDQIVNGTGLWIFCLGFSAFVFRTAGTTVYIKGFSPIQIPVLSELPVIGPVLFQLNILTYLGFLLIFVVAVILFRTPFGLLIKATGENPLAVDMAGHNVFLIRYISVLLCGAMSGLGGAYMSLGVLHRFSEDMIAGRGFIALCIVLFGNWNPWKIFVGVLLFSGIDAFQLRMQVMERGIIPYPLLLMLPYILTLVALSVAVLGKKNPPKGLFFPYIRGGQ
jgi:simple sugar transport system permease protein